MTDRQTDRQTELIFDNRQTNIAKGVAILLLLWHHLFYNSPNSYNKFISLYIFKGVPVECILADFCKVCVALFLILSGYGLYKSYESFICKNKTKSKFCLKEDFIFIKRHLIKLMSGYWFVYLIFVPMGFFFNRNPIEIYEGNILYFLLDFLGLSNLFKTPTMNETWWFMSLIILLYIFYPLLHKVLKYSPELLLLSSFFILIFYYLPNPSNIKIYLFPFVLGMYVSKYNVFSKIQVKLDNILKVLLVSFLAFTITLWIKATIFLKSVEFDGFFAFSIICISFMILSRIPFINKILESLGRQSAYIFMFHTFILNYYFRNFVYLTKYPVCIFIIFSTLCYLIALIISFVRKGICYDKLLNIKNKN